MNPGRYFRCMVLAAGFGMASCLFAEPAAAQALAVGPTATRDSTATRPTVGELLVPATLGAAGGVWLGVRFGADLGWGGGDDPGLTSALLFGALGGAVGSVFVTALVPGSDTDGAGIVAAILVGSAAGAFGAYAGAAVSSGAPVPILLGYSLGQGLITASMFSSGR